MLSAIAAYYSLLAPRRSDGARAAVLEKIQLITSGSLLAAFIVLGFLTGDRSRVMPEPIIAAEGICTSPLASVEALRNAGCKLGD